MRNFLQKRKIYSRLRLLSPSKCYSHLVNPEGFNPNRLAPRILLTQKSTHWNPRASVHQARKVDQACQSIWPIDWQGDRVNVKFEGVSAGVPIIPHIGISASFADRIHDKRIFKCKRVINECVGRISRCTRRQNRLWVADYACVTKSKLRMCNSDDVN